MNRIRTRVLFENANYRIVRIAQYELIDEAFFPHRVPSEPDWFVEMRFEEDGCVGYVTVQDLTELAGAPDLVYHIATPRQRRKITRAFKLLGMAWIAKAERF
jgi:hypothetical protein